MKNLNPLKKFSGSSRLDTIIGLQAVEEKMLNTSVVIKGDKRHILKEMIDIFYAATFSENLHKAVIPSLLKSTVVGVEVIILRVKEKQAVTF